MVGNAASIPSFETGVARGPTAVATPLKAVVPSWRAVGVLLPLLLRASRASCVSMGI